MFRKVLLYGMPVYLYGLELLLKALAQVSADSVAGPTLAGAGIGFLLPLTELKPIPALKSIEPSLAAALKKLPVEALRHVHSPRDKNFTDLVWLTFLCALGAWMYSLYLTIRPLQSASVNWPLAIGCAIFVIAVVYSEIKERL